MSEQKIVLKDANGVYFVKVADIYFCEADGPYTRFHIAGSDDIIVSKNLKEYEELLQHAIFTRCHHSYLVNLSKVKSFEKNDGGCLLLEGGMRVPVSHRKKEEVLNVLGKMYVG